MQMTFAMCVFVSQVAYFNNFLADPKRPMLPEHPSSRAGGPPPPPSRDGGGYQPRGGYQGPPSHRGGMMGGYSRPPMYHHGGYMIGPDTAALRVSLHVQLSPFSHTSSASVLL